MDSSKQYIHLLPFFRLNFNNLNLVGSQRTYVTRGLSWWQRRINDRKYPVKCQANFTVAYWVHFTRFPVILFLPSANECFYTRLSFCSQGGGVRLPWADTHTPVRHPTPYGQTSPRDGHCSGRYASYWNGFLYNADFSVSLCVPL